MFRKKNFAIYILILMFLLQFGILVLHIVPGLNLGYVVFSILSIIIASILSDSITEG
jgi:hypothetical protein